MGRWLEKKDNWLKKEDVEQETVENYQDYGVIFIPLRCPNCNSKNVKCYSSHPPIRYHKCRECGCSFKSVEEV
mgnify:CR=1 FL=1